jgi:hypothetical protein
MIEIAESESRNQSTRRHIEKVESLLFIPQGSPVWKKRLNQKIL